MNVEVALKTIEEVLNGDDFKVGSKQATQAIETARKLLDWTTKEGNMQVFTRFCDKITIQFEKCFKQKRSLRSQEENLLREYHQLRVSASFQDEWETFLMESIHESASPTFFQYVSHRMFRGFIKSMHAVTQTGAEQTSKITKDEENALRYIAGYVCRKVQAKLVSADSLQHKEEMILFMTELSGDEWNEERGSEEWVNAIDRGGLWHVNDETYNIFCLIEEDIRKYLLVSVAKDLDEKTKTKI